jgi:opacity protein-like surface antigen
MKPLARLLPSPTLAAVLAAVATAACSAPPKPAPEASLGGPPIVLDIQGGVGKYDAEVDGSSGDLGDLEEPGVLGVQAWFPFADGPLGAEVGLHGLASSDEVVDTDFALVQLELSAGLGLRFPIGDPSGFQFVPYVGAGGLVSAAAFEVDPEGLDSEDDVDQSTGFYGRLGFAVPIGDSFQVGAEYRIVRGTDYTFDLEGLGEFDLELEEDRFVIFFGFLF